MRTLAVAATLLVTAAAIAGCSGHAAIPAGQGQAPPLPGRFVEAWSRPTLSTHFAAGDGAVALLDPAGDLTIDSAATGRLEYLIKAVRPWRYNALQIIGNRLYAELATSSGVDGGPSLTRARQGSSPTSSSPAPAP